MMQGLYIGATGLKTHGDGMQVVGHNIANVNTVAFKQQQWLFQDLMYQQVVTGSSANVVENSKGMGARMADIRTLHTEGAFEPGNAMTDLAITGKGFFQVRKAKGDPYYTRAGNFRFDAAGVLRNPQGLALSGIRIQNGVEVGGLTEISLDMKSASVTKDPPKGTSSITAQMNLNVQDSVQDAANPFFSLLSAWNGAATIPEPSGTGYSQALKYYDSNGTVRALTVHFDQAEKANGQTVLEYIVTIPPALDGRANAQDANGPVAGAGLLMSGTMTFSGSGELLNMSAYTPGAGDLKDLSNWTPAPLQNGLPVVAISQAGLPVQTIALNFGAQGANGWTGTGSAADVGVSKDKLPGLTSPAFDTTKTSIWPEASALGNFKQDGYPVGELSDVYVDASGYMHAEYSNGQSHALYRIPIFNFTSEDGLRREGNNLFLATSEAGETWEGVAGTENFGEIQGNFLEASNVELSKEMVSMIIMQRGFQSNSKVITTWDTMIQKAIELKR